MKMGTKMTKTTIANIAKMKIPQTKTKSHNGRMTPKMKFPQTKTKPHNVRITPKTRRISLPPPPLTMKAAMAPKRQ
jgi:hypothetical protein